MNNIAYVGENLGIHQLTYDVIEDCAMDIRSVLYENIVLTGCTTLFPGLPERLQVPSPCTGPVAHPRAIGPCPLWPSASTARL